ncbi:MAG: PIN domain-containing protein [Burkholderiaceae bacterium]|nr:PIN domain-containing protein [Burkholderiaceae bacterium]
MIYIDTSVFVALCTREAKSKAVEVWYEKASGDLISSVWTFTEFASALAIKERTGQITSKQSRSAWTLFEKICSYDVELLPIKRNVFYSAGLLGLVLPSFITRLHPSRLEVTHV